MEFTQAPQEVSAAPHRLAIVGRLVSMTRAEAARAMSLSGGELVEHVTRETSLVVVGSRGPQLQRNGKIPIPLARARRLIDEGCRLEIWSEERWLDWLGLTAAATGIRQRFTAGQMAEMLSVPRSRIDRWIASGLVRPVDESTGVALFDFRQVAAGRTLADLALAGIRLPKIRRAVSALARWLPDVGQPLADLSVSENARRLIVRTPDGRAAEATGQLLIEFEPPEENTSVRFQRTETETETFLRAVSYEQEFPHEAATLYRQLIADRGPHATLAFNLGNALYATEDVRGARDQFRRAVELDSNHASAWNNLANVLAELDQLEEAVTAYRRALAIDPNIHDAHFNLAETLVELGRAEEAVLHWQAYLASDSDSGWADYARERLQQSVVGR
jgi:tetratricopeptide (TPR) repeat protein